jgi:hypothetical protein
MTSRKTDLFTAGVISSQYLCTYSLTLRSSHNTDLLLFAICLHLFALNKSLHLPANSVWTFIYFFYHVTLETRCSATGPQETSSLTHLTGIYSFQSLCTEGHSLFTHQSLLELPPSVLGVTTPAFNTREGGDLHCYSSNHGINFTRRHATIAPG